MSDAATPATAPAPEGASDSDIIDAALDRMDAEDDVPAPRGNETEASQDDGDDPDQQPEETPTYRVKVRGQELEVSLPELLNGYSRTEDYKAKTAEVAEARRQAEADRAAVAAERQRYAQQLDVYVQQAQAFDPILAEGMKTDWARLAQENPVEYVQRSAQFQQRQAQVQQAIQERQHLAQREMAERIQSETAKLSEALPEWADEGKRASLVRDMTGFLGNLGFTPDELARIQDSRVILLVHRAMQADKMASAKAAAEGKRVVPPAPRVQRPGSAQADRGRADVAAKRQAMRGNDSQKVDFILAQLEKE